MAIINRYYVEKKENLRHEAKMLAATLREEIGITKLTGVRQWVRYDIETDNGDLPLEVTTTILSEPFTDIVYAETLPVSEGEAIILAVEPLPGQYDQRADSCAQCIELISGKRPNLRTATVYAFFGLIDQNSEKKIIKYLVNPVENRLAKLTKPKEISEIEPVLKSIETIPGFLSLDKDDMVSFIQEQGLAMDVDDLLYMQEYFKRENRNPTETELRVIDTYWSDHCRHTTFNTKLNSIKINDDEVRKGFEEYLDIREKVYGEQAIKRPVTLMDMGTIATKYLKKIGAVDGIDESEEINACSVEINVSTKKGQEPWLYMFKNETHNHPTEIEPFGGAATCLGGAIRDPLSGRSYVYQGLRVSGAADPRTPLNKTLPGKLPQRRICRLAADGFSSYGNQIGVPTGLVDEIYHPGYEAKRMEVGAVIAAAPKKQIYRCSPEAGDLVVLVGGRTGRDGCGGATGSSKTHTEESLEQSGSEVQKGNPVEERKIQRLFRRPEIARSIRRCNDFGAGGVSVAIGELAAGVFINLDAVPKKYSGLNGTELAISESQERMACVINPSDWDAFQKAANEENVEATVVAEVTKTPRLVMQWREEVIVDLEREFLDSAGASKSMDIRVEKRLERKTWCQSDTLLKAIEKTAEDLNVSSKRGLVERFDSTVGAGTVLMPYGGQNQLTPIQTMAAKIPLLKDETSTTSLFTYGFDAQAMSVDPFMGAYDAVVESVAKLIAAGTISERVYLSLQEYFHSLRNDPIRWGKPFQAVLGALLAQLDLGIPAIGGKDSMSGSFEEMDVPPTLISFATTISDAARIISPEFKAPGHKVAVFSFSRKENGRVDGKAFRDEWKRIAEAIAEGVITAAWAISRGGLPEALLKMTLGNGIGVACNDDIDSMVNLPIGSFVFELTEPLAGTDIIGETIGQKVITQLGQAIPLESLRDTWEAVLEGVYGTKMEQKDIIPDLPLHSKRSSLICKNPIAKPRVLIPVFPGSNCEYETARAFQSAGALVETLVITNQTYDQLLDSVDRMRKQLKNTQILALPGGFSFGDEPDGSGKFIAAFCREKHLQEAIEELLTCQDGLILGICNGFQALVKLGLLPYGRITDPQENDCILTHNLIHRHQSKYVMTRIVSTASPWLTHVSAGELHSLPISHGEGRFVAPEKTLKRLSELGQIATQYTNLSGQPDMNIAYNPSGSMWAIEGLISRDGRILGKMGHSERIGPYLAKNIPGHKNQFIFDSGVSYFTK